VLGLLPHHKFKKIELKQFAISVFFIFSACVLSVFSGSSDAWADDGGEMVATNRAPVITRPVKTSSVEIVATNRAANITPPINPAPQSAPARTSSVSTSTLKAPKVAATTIPSPSVTPDVKAELTAEPKTPIINTKLIAEVDSNIIVKLDGETLASTQVHRTEKGALYVNATPIFQSLNNDFEYDAERKALIVRRSQDGVVMELYTDTGIVKQNGKALGKLRHFGEVSEDRLLLTANAIAVLSGAAG